MRLLTESIAAAAGVSEMIELDANSIVDAMKFIHGGTWSVDIDHESCFVLIALDLPNPLPAQGKRT